MILKMYVGNRQEKGLIYPIQAELNIYISTRSPKVKNPIREWGRPQRGTEKPPSLTDGKKMLNLTPNPRTAHRKGHGLSIALHLTSCPG